MKEKNVEMNKVLSFFVALSGGENYSKKALSSLVERKFINKRDMGEVLKRASKGLSEVVKEIKNEATKRWILRETYIAAYLDRKITSKERRSLKRIRSMLRVKDEDERKIVKWVKKYIKLMEEGDNLIFY